MRSGVCVHLLGGFDGELSAVPVLLDEMGYHVLRGDPDDHASPAVVRLIGLKGPLTLPAMELRQRALTSGGLATLAILPSSDPALVAMAMALGCDDILTLPINPDELPRILKNLRHLARRQVELRLRAQIAKRLLGTAELATTAPIPQRAKVLMVGSIGSSAPRICEMLQPAQIVFATSSEAAANHLNKSEFELIFADMAVADQSWLSQCRPAHTLVIWLLDQAQDLLRRRRTDIVAHRQNDFLSVGLPSDLMRGRLRVLRRLTTLGRDLVRPPEQLVHPNMIDPETGCYNASYARGYLAMRSGDESRQFSCIELAPPDIGLLVKQLGFARMSDWFWRSADMLKRHLRCDDLLCHLGNGHFSIVLQECSTQKVEEIIDRLIGVSGQDLRLVSDSRQSPMARPVLQIA